MYTVTKRFEFDAAHRLFGYEGKCKHLHGHHYVAEVTVKGPTLDDLGMLTDFGVLKRCIGEWIDDWWDHNVLLSAHDPLRETLLSKPSLNAGRLPYLVGNYQPTAEWMAKILFDTCRFILPPGVEVDRVRIYETPDCWTEYYNHEEQEEQAAPREASTGAERGARGF